MFYRTPMECVQRAILYLRMNQHNKIISPTLQHAALWWRLLFIHKFESKAGEKRKKNEDRKAKKRTWCNKRLSSRCSCFYLWYRFIQLKVATTLRRLLLHSCWQIDCNKKNPNARIITVIVDDKLLSMATRNIRSVCVNTLTVCLTVHRSHKIVCWIRWIIIFVGTSA